MLALGLALLLVAGAPDAPQRVDEETAAALRAVLVTVREAAELKPLETSEPLQRLADRRASEIAARPAARRLPHPVPFDDVLDDLDDLSGLEVIERIVVVPSEWSGSKRIRAAWDNPEAGALALDERSAAVGLGAWSAVDGALVMVALFQVGDLEKVTIADRESIERLLFEEINQIRLEHGFRALAWSTRLLRVARGHSEAMLAGGFLGHESADGAMPADRVRRARIAFRLVGENVANSLRPLGAMHGVVEEWMDSPAHRANILTPDFRETAIGAAIAPDGSFYVTQLFLEP